MSPPLSAADLEAPSASLKESSSLTKFQLRVLEVLCNGPKHGLGIGETLDPLFEEKVNRGCLYPNLDTLVGEGYIAKAAIDRRTNESRLTDAGRDVLAADHQYRRSRLETVE